MYSEQVEFVPWMQEFFSICKSISVMHHINKLRNKNHMVISIDAEKSSDKFQHPLMIKTVQKVYREGTYLNIIKVLYDKLTANTIFIGEKAESIPSKIRNKTSSVHCCHFYSTYFWKSWPWQIEKKNK